MDLDSIRRLALALPEAHEAPHFDLTSFRVGSKIFATAPLDGVVVRIFVDESEAEASVAEGLRAPSCCCGARRFRVSLSRSRRPIRDESPNYSRSRGADVLRSAWSPRSTPHVMEPIEPIRR